MSESDPEEAYEPDPQAGSSYHAGVESDPDRELGDDSWWVEQAEKYTAGQLVPEPGTREAQALTVFQADSAERAAWLASFLEAQA
jgi:hypothetical protein